MDQATPPPSLEDILQRERWRHRVILLRGPRGAREITALKDELERERVGLEERHVVVIEQLSDSVEVRLIGKDGGEKARWKRPVKPREIFEKIDAMPMRQDEQKRQEQGTRARP